MIQIIQKAAQSFDNGNLSPHQQLIARGHAFVKHIIADYDASYRHGNLVKKIPLLTLSRIDKYQIKGLGNTRQKLRGIPFKQGDPTFVTGHLYISARLYA